MDIIYKKYFALIPLLLAMLLLFAGCTINIGGRNIRGTGDMVSRDIEVASFSDINVSGNFRVIYRHADTPALTVVMQENLFDHLTTSVRGGTLQIGSRRGFDTVTANRPRVYVYAPYLTGADFSGAVSASGWDTVQGQRFRVDVSGAASMDISLDVRRLDVDASGAVSLEFSGTADAIYIDGSGAVTISAGELAIEGGRVSLSGVGNVYLSTLENVTVNISGLGRVREAN